MPNLSNSLNFSSTFPLLPPPLPNYQLYSPFCQTYPIMPNLSISCPAYAKLLRFSPLMPIYPLLSNFSQFFPLLLYYVQPFRSCPSCAKLVRLSLVMPVFSLLSNFSQFFPLLPKFCQTFPLLPSLSFYAPFCPTSLLLLTHVKLSNISYPSAKLVPLFSTICPSFFHFALLLQNHIITFALLTVYLYFLTWPFYNPKYCPPRFLRFVTCTLLFTPLFVS
jgi:hypothetical protein